MPVTPEIRRGAQGGNAHTLVASGKGLPVVRCNACGEHFPVKSNLGIAEELGRIVSGGLPGHSCPDPSCVHHSIAVSEVPSAYQQFGSTSIGSKRYRCKACKSTFTVKPAGLNPIAKQIHSDKNPQIFAMLSGKMPLRRICEAAGVSAPVLYQRIDFLYRQCVAFQTAREDRLARLELPRLYLGTDRQDHVVNWSDRKDKRNVLVTAVATADNLSGYVFGMHTNFDDRCDPAEIEAAARAVGDLAKAGPHRRFARQWLTPDLEASAKRRSSRASGNIEDSIEEAYEMADARTDVESPEIAQSIERLPGNGMLIHAEYTLYGHFLHLRRLLDGVEKVRFFLDQDSGMRAACLGAWADRVTSRTCDAFYVRIGKDLTVDQKRKLVRTANETFVAQMARHPGLSEEEVRLLLLKQRIREAKRIGQWKDRWVLHPTPTMSEPEKAMCYLTDLSDYDEDHLAWLYNKASLHAVDSWFNRLRRRSSMLERPIDSGGNRGRSWNGYSAYRPGQLQKLMTIYRACHNYIWLADGQSKTPAMRLGLARAPLDYKDMIYFT